MEKPNYYSVIPAEVRYDKDLSSSEKMFYGEISALTQKEGYCWASSSYFENLYGVSRRTIYNWTKRLADKGYIRIEYVKGENGNLEGRKIFLTPGKNISLGPEKKISQGPEKKISRKHTRLNNTSINSSAEAGDEFNSPQNMAALQEIERQEKWQAILSVWNTSESAPVLKQAYKKFSTLRTEHQQEVVDWINGLDASSRKMLSTFWISTYLKHNMLHPVTISQDIEKKRAANKARYEKESATKWNKNRNDYKY